MKRALLNGKIQTLIQKREKEMTAREYLDQARRLDQQIGNRLEQLERLRSLTQKITVSYEGEAVSHSQNLTSLQDSIVRLMEAEQELNRQVEELVSLKVDIAGTISKVRNDTYRLILEDRSLCFHDWNLIAKRMHYSRRWVLDKHERALLAVDSILRGGGSSGA